MPASRARKTETAALDSQATVICDRLSERVPNQRMASVEDGAEFLGDLFRQLRSAATKMPGYFKEDPVDTLKRHVWINPFWEDEPRALVDLMGADRVIFGSDWPHIEGMPRPLDYLPELAEFDDADRRRILLDNVTEPNTPSAGPGPRCARPAPVPPQRHRPFQANQGAQKARDHQRPV